MTEAGKGVLAMAAAATIWGLSGIYYKALARGAAARGAEPPHALERGLLSASCWRRRGGPRRWRRLVAPAAGLGASLAVSRDADRGRTGCGFIAAVQTGRALEASLGYYIFPLFAVALGLPRARRAVLRRCSRWRSGWRRWRSWC